MATIRAASNPGCAWPRPSGFRATQVESLTDVLPGVRFAVDAYVNFARRAPWQEAVCASLTELFAPEIHKQRLANWPEHYPWIDRAGLHYFQSRVSLARRDVEFSLAVTLDRVHDARGAGARAGDPAVQARRAVADERRHGAALWSAIVSVVIATARPLIGRGFRLQWEPAQNAHVLLYPEGMVKLNAQRRRDHESLRRRTHARGDHRGSRAHVRRDRADRRRHCVRVHGRGEEMAGDPRVSERAIDRRNSRPGPPLWLLLELTYRCPLHCVYCSNPTEFARTGAGARHR